MLQLLESIAVTNLGALNVKDNVDQQ